MTKQEINKAKELLNDRTERFEIASIDTGGLCLTAHWMGGGQKIFYSIHSVEEWLREKLYA